ncbi:hypothetical protein HanPSC8_Chr08g0308271 [Helianthus annuus]|nr:hypothetical protein HanPSC8_Chr08g0308271 [Helianthus annuus]
MFLCSAFSFASDGNRATKTTGMFIQSVLKPRGRNHGLTGQKREDKPKKLLSYLILMNLVCR